MSLHPLSGHGVLRDDRASLMAVDAGVRKTLPEYMQRLIELPDWSSGRDVKDFIDKAYVRAASRQKRKGLSGDGRKLEAVDVEQAFEMVVRKKAGMDTA
ncbi:MAG: hypothetical protein ACT4TC_17735 [Myxococcaceae bacterium]